MKKLFLFNFAIMATALLNVFAAPIDSYQKLTSAMLEGKQFVFLLDQKQIAGFPGGPTRYFIPTTMELALATHVTQGHVTTSHLQLIDTVQDTPFYQSIRYTFYEDNTVMVQFTSYYPGSFKQMGNPIIYMTSLDKGIHVKTIDRAEKDDVTLTN